MHRIIREGDEYTCTCGLRWGIDEDDPHHIHGFQREYMVKQTKNKTYSTHKVKSNGPR